MKFDSFGKNINVSEVKIETQEDILEGLNHSTYYKVTIDDLYDSDVTERESRKKIIEKMLQSNIADAIFERYPLKIFNRDLFFYINKKRIEPNDYVINLPILKTIPYSDKKGNQHNIQFQFFNIKGFEKRKVFLTISLW